jgi:TPR repeat protein
MGATWRRKETPSAQGLFGFMYEKGQGGPRDYVNDDYADNAAAIIAGAVERLGTDTRTLADEVIE